jgi:predicted XRE-type DNA-binding protein
MNETSALKPVIWIGSSRRGEVAYGLCNKMKKKAGYEVGSDNIFADIGLPNADEHLVKAQLVYKIDGLLKSRGLKQVEAAKLFGVKQPDVSNMLRGDFRQFSVERLMRFLVALGQDVEIVVKPHRGTRKAAQLRVSGLVGPA